MTIASFDLLIVTASRGRPAQLARLLEATSNTAVTKVMFAIGLDADDPHMDGYREILYPPHHPEISEMMRDCRWEVAPRMPVGDWVNRLWLGLRRDIQFGYVAFLGDDHVPQTHAWDARLMAACDAQRGGAGIAYGNDGLQGENLPTAPLMSAAVPEALGWLWLPQLRHYYADNVWKDLGAGAGCLAYLGDVVVEHAHHVAGKAKFDDTYRDAWANGEGLSADHAAYRAWFDRSAADVAAVAAINLRGERQ